MFIPFANPEQLIQEDTPHQLVLARLNKLKLWGVLSLILAVVTLVASLVIGLKLIGGGVALLYAGLGVWLVTSERSIIFDLSRQSLLFSTQYLLFEHKTEPVLFEDIAAVYLDYEERAYPGFYRSRERVWRRWLIFLALHDTQTVTLAHYQQSYNPDHALSKQTVAWEKLAEKICAATDKFLIRTPSVPSRAPHTFVDVIDQIVQRRLAALPPSDRLSNQSVRLRSYPTGRLEIIVNGANYRELNDITDTDVHNLIQEAVDEWRTLNSRSKTGSQLSINGREIL